MSRYELEPKQENRQVVVGWDDMLNTLFLQVKDTSPDVDEEKAMVLWLPKAGEFIHDLPGFMVRVRHYAVMDSDIVKKLMIDMD